MRNMIMKGLPHFASGIIVKGFGRGSKELGTPTANFSAEVVEALPKDFSTGVYYGWAQVDKSPVYPMVLSVGWNPFYQNVQKSMETHILHEFPSDFYGSLLKVCMVGFLRPEKNFNSLDELKSAIQEDITQAKCQLDSTELLEYKKHRFFEEDEVSVTQPCK